MRHIAKMNGPTPYRPERNVVRRVDSRRLGVDPDDVLLVADLRISRRQGQALRIHLIQCLFQPRLHGLLGNHLVDGEVLAYLAEAVDEAVSAQPVGVVDQQAPGPPAAGDRSNRLPS